jgi:hypothetical protein
MKRCFIFVIVQPLDAYRWRKAAAEIGDGE